MTDSQEGLEFIYRPSSYTMIPGIKTITHEYDNIIKVICGYYNISPKTLKSKSRIETIVLPRQVAMYFLHKKMRGKMSLKDIGQKLGGYDHSTVHYSKGLIQGYIDVDKTFATTMKILEERIDSFIIPSVP